MLVDKMKELPLVKESAVLKIDPIRRLFSRYDKTVYISEKIDPKLTVKGNQEAYVQAQNFFSLFAELSSIDITDTLCHLTLKNGAEYDLPFIDVSWDNKEFTLDTPPDATIKLESGRLSSATLKNLANPMLQCIYIDSASAVSCNSMVACIDGNTTSRTPLTLPPDIINIIEGTQFDIRIIDGNYVLAMNNGVISVPIPGVDYAETAETLRDSLPVNQLPEVPVKGLIDSLKRLSTFSDQVVFESDRVYAGDNFEPFNFPTANNQFIYSIQNLLSVLPFVRTIAQSDYALLLRGDKFVFMISPESDE